MLQRTQCVALAASFLWMTACEEVARVDLENSDSTVYFSFPLAERALFYQSIGVDHDPEVHDPGIESSLCTDHSGRSFPWCYDEHDGTDYLLEGAFDAMDAGSTPIIAAADGTVIATDDGNYDRCHVDDNLLVSCDGFDRVANHVILEHADGNQTLYWHMKTDSVAVKVGDEVRCGDVLGLVGSSGISSFPHLHFEVHDSEGVTIDPYSGDESQEKSYWVDQGSDEGFPHNTCGAASETE